MPNNSPAQPVLTDEEIQDIADGFDIYGAKPEFARAIASALLSKLRAPVAEERAAFEQAMRDTYQMVDPFKPPPAGSYFRGEHEGIIAALKTVRENFERAALASAPVAGEAQPVAYRVLRKTHDGDWKDDGRCWCDGAPSTDLKNDIAQRADRWRIEYAYAAPQASEAVRDALEMLIREAQNVADDHHRPRYTRLDEAIQSAPAALSAQPGAQRTGGSDAVPNEPLRIFSAGMWTYDGTGQAFTHTELDEAAFVTYRDALPAQKEKIDG